MKKPLIQLLISPYVVLGVIVCWVLIIYLIIIGPLGSLPSSI